MTSPCEQPARACQWMIASESGSFVGFKLRMHVGMFFLVAKHVLSFEGGEQSAYNSRPMPPIMMRSLTQAW